MPGPLPHRPLGIAVTTQCFLAGDTVTLVGQVESEIGAGVGLRTHEFVQPIVYAEMSADVRGSHGERLDAVRGESKRLLDWYAVALQGRSFPPVGRPRSLIFEQASEGLRGLIDEYEELYERGDVESPRVRLEDLAMKLGCSPDTILRSRGT